MTIEYLKCYYKEHYNDNQEDVLDRDIKPIKSKIPKPPAFGGKSRTTPINSKQHNLPAIVHSDDYEAIRALEREYSEKMRSNFSLASKSYQRGDRSSAKRYAQEGNRYKTLFLQEKYLNTYRTLASKNSHLNLSESIDLHGLHRSEVPPVLSQFISEIQQKLITGEIKPNMGKRGHTVTIITGKGNHSRFNRSVVKEEVREFLKGRGIGFRMSEGYFTVSIV